MRQLKFNNSTTPSPFIPSKLPQLGVLTHIDELTKHDLIYCFHQLKEGDALTLSRDYQRFWDDNAVMIHFNQFKLGYLNSKTSAMIVRHLNKGNTVKVIVKQAFQHKNSPFQSLDIQITIYNGFEIFH